MTTTIIMALLVDICPCLESNSKQQQNGSIMIKLYTKGKIV